MIIQGDCIEEMKKLEENSVDAIITDPPYGLEFMGKEWDKLGDKRNKDEQTNEGVKTFLRAGKNLSQYKAGYEAQQFHNQWATQCLRVLKPGGFLLSFGGTRTYHRMVCGIEDAGFEIRDTIMWLYGSGFPKSLNIGKQIDKNVNKTSKELIKFGELIREYRDRKGISQRELGKRVGSIRELIGLYELKGNIQQQFPTKEFWLKIREELQIPNDKEYIYQEAEREVVSKKNKLNTYSDIGYSAGEGNYEKKQIDITLPATKEAKEWEGWGTALKPAVEPIVIARKPLSEKNVALNILKWGTGGINIDESRIVHHTEQKKDNIEHHNVQGRFPANIILDEEAGKMLDEQSGDRSSTRIDNLNFGNKGGMMFGNQSLHKKGKSIDYKDKGGASRFFYCAKASKSERNFGLEEKQTVKQYEDKSTGHGNLQNSEGFERFDSYNKNNHPTVKPIKLMEYLIKLVSQIGGTVLDPFMGSGTTLIACAKLNRIGIGIEKEHEYIEIANARIKPYLEQSRL